jgi:perosamine synthetase
MIPVCEPVLGEKEIELVLDCLKSGWISSAGKYIESFEEKWADYCAMRYGVAVSSGTAALHLAVKSLNLQSGDEVILPTFTIISCAQAIVACGAVPVLVDSDPVTWQMDVTQIASRITERSRAIMAVHIYGHPVDMGPLLAVAKANDLKVIEDAAEAHGAEYKDQKCGSFGHLSVFSFFANKLITTGEGGMVLTNDDDLAEELRSLRNLCFQEKQRFLHQALGFNYRLTNIQAAIGLAQFSRFQKIVAAKRKIAHWYATRLNGLPGLELPVEAPWAKNVYWVYGIVLDETTGLDAAAMAQRLRSKGVDTRPFFLGMHEQPAFRERGLFLGEKYPVAERLARQGLYLPTGLNLSEETVSDICCKVSNILKQG